MALTITGLSKTYPNGVKALKNLSLTIGNNTFGLLGPNGAGKSTLMRTIATLLPARYLPAPLHQADHRIRLPRRPLGRLLPHHHLCFSGLIFGEAAGTFAPWADHTRIVHGHFGWYVHAFFATTVIQIFFLGSLFFTIAALTRKLFIVYL